MVRTNSLTIFIYASNEPKSVLARDLGVAKRQWRLATTETECRGRDNLRNSRSVFLIVYADNEAKLMLA